MNIEFIQLQNLPFILGAFAGFFLLVLWFERRFFRLIEKYWFYKRSFFSYLSSFFLILGFGVLLLSLLDARGPEERFKAPVPTERTIILIDTSASMLAEDVKPSRLQKAALIAKHFARKATGHQISVVAFAEIQKKIVPFTNDLDLIDSRLDSLKSLRNQNGSSALSLAIQESIQYFQEIGGEARGNLLVLTDGEETADGVALKIPKEVHLALVGVGTEMGGRIPLDDSRGFRFGYKKHRGQDVITKLDERFFKNTVADVPSAKYWLANTYTLPSEEILEFFQGEQKKGGQEQDMVMRPVRMEWLVIPALLLLILGYVFKSIRVFTLSLFLIILPVWAAEDEVKLSPEVIQEMDRLHRGELTHLERLKLADDLYKSGAKDEALGLYQENLTEKVDPTVPPEAYMNYGTAMLEKGELDRAISTYQKLSESLKFDQKKRTELQDVMDKNLSVYFQKQEQKKKEKKDQKDEKKDDQQNDKDQNGKNDQQGSQGQKKENQKGQQDPDKKDQNKSEGQDKDQKKKDEKKDSGDDQNKDDKNNENKEKDSPPEPPKSLPPRKMPAKLKQLMSDDRQLQMKMIENGTRDLNKNKSRTSKDW